MEVQRDWMAFFERTEAQRAARQKLIRELDTDQRVKEVLLALNALSETDETTRWRADGSVQLSIPIAVIAWQLGRVENTAKSYIKLAGSTPYLEVSESTHRSHTYLVCWLAIVDRAPGNEMHAGGCRNARNSRGDVQDRGSTSVVPGGQLIPSEGVNPGVKRGSNAPQLTGSNGGRNGGQLIPSKPGLKDRVFQGSDSKKPGLKTSPGGQLTPSAGLPVGLPGSESHPAGSLEFWRWWRRMIDRRDLRFAANVEELYGLAVACGLIAECADNRLRIYAQAIVDVRRAKSPGALFRENVAWRRWYANCEIEDEARRMMDAVDLEPHSVGRVAPSHEELESSLAGDEADVRESAMARLAAWGAAKGS